MRGLKLGLGLSRGAAPGGLYPAYRHYSILDPLNEYALGAVGKLHDSGTSQNDAAQYVASYRPSYVGSDYFATDGVGEFIRCGSPPLEETTIFVINIPATANQGIYGAFTTTPPARSYLGVNVSGRLGIGAGDKSWTDLDSGVSPPASWCVLTVQISQANHIAKLFLNGALILNRAFIGTKYTGSVYIGCIYNVLATSSSIFGAHKYREIVQLATVADSQRIRWETYLKAKWGLL